MSEKVAVVTGSSGGIGAAVAEKFGACGYAIYVTYLDHESSAKQVAERITALGSTAYPVHLDVRSEASVSALFASITERHGKLDVLVNNAVREVSKPLTEQSLDEWKTILETKLVGAFLCTREALPLFEKAESPSVVAMSTYEAQQPSPDYPGYGVANAGVDAFVKAMALFLPRYGARCNAVCPGPVATPLWGPDEHDANLWEKLARENPVGRNATTQDVAEVVYLVATEPTRMLNGNFVYVNGGNHLRPA